MSVYDVKRSLLWYDFRFGASILKTSRDIVDTNQYDYIICADPENPGAELFASLAKRLSPGGRLLIALDNKYGLKYWCGTCGGELGKPFGELEGGRAMLSGAELRRELLRSGFVSQKWYYPMPDHRFPKAVYSENKLPNRFFATISPARQTSGAGVLLREASLLPGIIEGGAFTFMCNSYIVEAALEKDAVMCAVDFAVPTTYRTPERAFITTVRSDGTARKTAVHPESRESLKSLAENHAMLIQRGLDVLPIAIEGDSAVMSVASHETLWEYMQGLAADGRFDCDEFIRIFDRLRDEIIKASPLMPPGSCGWDEMFGPVQKNAYPELVPANCFFDKACDAFIFFDQEHALQNTPYSVPLSRAIMSIRYSEVLWVHAGASKLLPELVRRYGLESCWDKLLEIERGFLDRVFNYEATRAIDTAAGASLTQIEINRRAHDTLAAVTSFLSGYKSVGVYGYGKRGKRLAAVLELLERPAAFIADRNTGGLPPDARADVIVVTPMDGTEEIAAGLRRVTDIPVITLDEVFRGF